MQKRKKKHTVKEHYQPRLEKRPYLCNVWSHAVRKIVQITVCQQKSFVRVSKAALPSHTVKRIVDVICCLAVVKPIHHLGIVAIGNS